MKRANTEGIGETLAIRDLFQKSCLSTFLFLGLQQPQAGSSKHLRRLSDDAIPAAA